MEEADDKVRNHAGTGRLEAFSDGVFAVAITLLVLSLKVPERADLSQLQAPHNTLADWLATQGSWYLAYVLSFVTILIMWVNHHSMFRFIKRTDHLFLLLNGLLLLIISTFPFATGLLAQYLQHQTRDANYDLNLKTAQLVYSGLSLVMALAFNRMWAYASYNERLLAQNANRVLVRTITAQFRFGPALYAFTLLLAFVSPLVSLAMCIALALFYMLPSTITRATGS